jgi:hypothetical protein
MGRRVRVLVACESSGRIRDAFLARGHDAWSCDLLPTESPIPDRHFQTDIFGAIGYTCASSWDLMIAHPECTYLANSGNKHLYIGKKKINGRDPERWLKMAEGAEFFNRLWKLPIPRICMENPIQHCHARQIIGPKTQVIQPWMFGHAETKATCLWLKGLPKLAPTKIMPKPHDNRVHFESPSPKSDPDRRKRNRSRTLAGVAAAMADQWGSL